MGGAKNATKAAGHVPKHIILIIVNAATRPENPMDSSIEIPSSLQVVDAVTDTQMNRYTIESLSLLEEALTEWATEISTPKRPVVPYFITIDFESIGNKKQRTFFNNMATSFSLPDNEVDRLIEAGHKLLRQSTEFQRLLETIRKEDRTQAAVQPG
jgi:NTE family protein